VVTVDHEPAPETDPLTRLRTAAAAVSDLDVPGDGEQHDDGAGIDAVAHADRYDELHDALVAVLADVDRG
jgi:hypothetical protein